MSVETDITINKWKSKEEFKERVLHFARIIGVEIKSLYFRPMANKWASCSTNGNLNFNPELLALDKEIGDYVIVHELLHSKTPNHGKLWKSLMRVHLGNYEIVKDRLLAT
ncbi:M48 family metallopeptidase [Candidatus Saganbacteria bacterium]|uniref:M48 family metallopeptidase n=1 Tax=Candidatus Saganbacteria bacterium TaxID=2575572 RepID=A0A9D6YVL4_UNCSA|nr:M48 family metallopeptidase [Candidatus Saganbacteria bacterium]